MGGACFVAYWLSGLLSSYAGNSEAYCIYVGMFMPGIIGLTAFPALIRMAINSNSDLARGKIYNPDEE